MAAITENKKNVYKLLVDVFEASILEPDLTDLIKNLSDLYMAFTSQGFESSLEDILMLSLSESKRSKDVSKIFQFISEFAVMFDNEYKSEQNKKAESQNDEKDSDDEGGNEIVHPLLKYIFQILVKWSKASSYIVRYRSCQLLYAILSNIQDKGVGEIDSATYEQIEDVIQQRRIDVSSTVRANAVLLAKFFQDPSSNNDPVISGLCWQMQNDPNPHVRQNILEIITACEETVIPITNRFLYDKSAAVRNAALLLICSRISACSYTDYQQVVILKHCFSDSSAIVRKNAEERLIPVWFRTYGDKLCVFLKHLRLGNYSLDRLPFIKDLLSVLFRTIKIAQLLDEINLDLEVVPKMPLTSERIFLWHSFYMMAQKEERLAKYIPNQEVLSQFIFKCILSSSVSEDKACILNELISFAMDITNELEDENRQKLIKLPYQILQNPFVPSDVIPYAVAFFSDYTSVADGQNVDDILLVVKDLQTVAELAPEEGKKEIVLKCLAIMSAILAQEGLMVAQENIIPFKNKLIVPHLNSDNLNIREEAFKAFSLYCLLDLDEAKTFGPLLMDALHDSPSILRGTLLKCILDILAIHGLQVLSTELDDSETYFISTLENLLPLAENSYQRAIIMEGILKLYVLHHTWSPVLLAKLILPMFIMEENDSEKYCFEKFLQSYGESRLEAECLSRTFLTIINYLFKANKSDPLYNINIKTAALQLLEFSKSFDESPDCALEEKFKDLLVIKLTRKCLKTPGRISALDLQDICSQIMPKDLQKLLKLEENVKLIIKGLQSPLFLQSNPYFKKSVNFFSAYLKKIQVAISSAAVSNENKAQRNKITERGNQQNMLSRELFNASKTKIRNEHENTFTLHECSFPELSTEKQAKNSETICTENSETESSENCESEIAKSHENCEAKNSETKSSENSENAFSSSEQFDHEESKIEDNKSSSLSDSDSKSESEVLSFDE